MWHSEADCDACLVCKGAINRIQIGQKHPHECITASSDGSCILWDLNSLKRKCTFSASTFFKDVAWSSDESQLVTAGLQALTAACPCAMKQVSCPELSLTRNLGLFSCAPKYSYPGDSCDQVVAMQALTAS